MQRRAGHPRGRPAVEGRWVGEFLDYIRPYTGSPTSSRGLPGCRQQKRGCAVARTTSIPDRSRLERSRSASKPARSRREPVQNAKRRPSARAAGGRRQVDAMTFHETSYAPGPTNGRTSVVAASTWNDATQVQARQSESAPALAGHEWRWAHQSDQAPAAIVRRRIAPDSQKRSPFGMNVPLGANAKAISVSQFKHAHPIRPDS